MKTYCKSYFILFLCMLLKIIVRRHALNTCIKTSWYINFQIFLEKLQMLNYFVFAWLHNKHHINDETLYMYQDDVQHRLIRWKEMQCFRIFFFWGGGERWMTFLPLSHGVSITSSVRGVILGLCVYDTV